MSREFCPKCGKVTNTTATESRRRAPNRQGKMRTVITRVYHCEVCKGFVRSEDVEGPGG